MRANHRLSTPRNSPTGRKVCLCWLGNTHSHLWVGAIGQGTGRRRLHLSSTLTLPCFTFFLHPSSLLFFHHTLPSSFFLFFLFLFSLHTPYLDPLPSFIIYC